MVMASGRWLGVRLDLLTSVFIGAVSVAAVLGSQDTGRYIMYICKVNQNLPPPKKKKKKKTMLNLKRIPKIAITV